mmetsp:Transcript_15636/g.34128  ORF Transcript_15636/g.34128 Transcript_15636/m.34128 type:complete len:343 (+) Transcript_15636:138-1166(+)|eukprot:CAMPEP_0172527384 /NCGR_PEP_ID=MMETSP1067-20121228/2081_1 /TAXON_ID=265564 ORGANISM="Thalassiosira punctigera, Strain Tpunct2005C2" /NCGR_SAMPLE_ID=MMETSP1067 /ASSEMBLY_ACC=CAM_ASM_000444 /LENGTH=342 /DNA_ID=CAMNT_0013311115 /DNA_START=111 /DNA_END=1139 /DNA_ORIENTATION=-
MTFECKLCRRFLVGIAAIWACASIALPLHRLQVDRRGHSSSDRKQRHQHRHLRSLQLTEYADPKSTSLRQGSDVSDNAPPTPGEDYIDTINIHIYVKTSGKSPFIERAMRIADTYGRDVAEGGGTIRFLFDTHNYEAVEEFARERPWVSVRRVEGTENQGNYKGESSLNDSLLHAAYKAQRLKTRAVFLHEDLDAETDAKPADWVCYLDDDMLVNYANLKVDLHEKEAQCSPDCLVSDRVGHGGIQYTQGGWCMNRELAQRVGNLLREKTDEDLHWDSTDDVSFNQYVMLKALGVLPTDSERFYSELSWRRRSPKFFKGMSIPTFGEKILPKLAVYHIRFTG